MNWSEFKILIVDDIEENLSVISSIIGEYKISISIARNGKDALKIARSKNPDLVLLDILMPEMDGYEVCRELKKDENLKEIPVIFLTALTEQESIIKGFDVGAVDYITKPFNQKELLLRIQTHLNLKKSRDIIEVQRKEIEESRNLIEIQNQNIISSIRYAQRIQNALLQTEAIFKAYMPDSFILFLPKDIVSGDFYWAQQIQETVFVAAADCTGHGIPGAFMSMLGISILNEIVLTKGIYETDEILNQMRERVIGCLNQGNSEGTNIQDGMDIAIVSINLTTKKLNYSGAFNPLLITRKNIETGAIELLEEKPDKMPIAHYITMKPFTKKTIQLFTNDKIYLFSDGYSDQFGGPSEKKFMLANLKKMLIDLYEKPMSEQKDLLHNTFFNWKGKKNQVDDVMILGLNLIENFGDVDLF